MISNIKENNELEKNYKNIDSESISNIKENNISTFKNHSKNDNSITLSNNEENISFTSKNYFENDNSNALSNYEENNISSFKNNISNKLSNHEENNISSSEIYSENINSKTFSNYEEIDIPSSENQSEDDSSDTLSNVEENNISSYKNYSKNDNSDTFSNVEENNASKSKNNFDLENIFKIKYNKYNKKNIRIAIFYFKQAKTFLDKYIIRRLIKIKNINMILINICLTIENIIKCINVLSNNLIFNSHNLENLINNSNIIDIRFKKFCIKLEKLKQQKKRNNNSFFTSLSNFISDLDNNPNEFNKINYLELLNKTKYFFKKLKNTIEPIIRKLFPKSIFLIL